MASVGIVVPAYRPDVDRLVDYLRSLDDRLDPAALRVELDGPADDRLRATPATVATSATRRGKGAAITAGFEALAGEVDRLAFADADGSVPADSVAGLVDALADADLAVGSRRHPEATIRTHQTAGRRRLGDAFAWLARRLIAPSLHDYQCGAKAITREAWRTVREHLYEPGFGWDVELVAMAAALDRRIVEVPVEWADRPDSTVDPIDAVRDLGSALLGARHRAKRLRGARFHDALGDRRDGPPALVDRPRTDE